MSESETYLDLLGHTLFNFAAFIGFCLILVMISLAIALRRASIRRALRSLLDAYEAYAHPHEPTVQAPDAAAEPKSPTDSIDTGPLTNRTVAALQRMDVKTFAELAEFSEESLLKAKGIGPASVREIQDALAIYGLELQPTDS